MDLGFPVKLQIKDKHCNEYGLIFGQGKIIYYAQD